MSEKLPLYRRLLIVLGIVVHGIVKWIWPVIHKVFFWHPLGTPTPVGSKCKHPYLWRFIGGVVYRVALMPIVLVVAWVVAVYALTHPPRAAVATTPEQYSLVCRDVMFTTDDGVSLSGWYINSLMAGNHDVITDQSWKQKRPAIVVCHGYRNARDELLSPLGIQLAKAGYDLLLFDFRGHGASGDAPVSFGTTEAADVMASVRFLQSLPGVDDQRIGILGTGMGGYAAILAGPRCPGVRCVVAIDTYPSVPSVFESMAQRLHAPNGLGTAFSWGMSAYFGHRLVDDSAVDSARSFNDRGLLLVTGSKSTRTPVEALQPIIAAASDSAAKLVVPGATRASAWKTPRPR